MGRKKNIPIRKSNRVLTLLICTGISLLTVLAYAKLGGNDFVNYDDPHYITDNLTVKYGLSWHSAVWAFESFHCSNWHPLTWLSHMLDCELFGLNPKGPHYINLLFHIANSCLLFLLLFKMTGRLWVSALVGVLFAVHPLHVESVAWASERKDVLSTFFFILTLLAYAQYASKGGWRWCSLALVLYALGLTAKPMLVSLPLVLVLLDVWPFARIALPVFSNADTTPARYARKTPLNIILEKLPFIALAVISSVITYIAQQKGGAMDMIQQLSFGQRFSNAMLSYWIYIGKLVMPINLAVLYPYPREAIALWKSAAAFSALVALTLFFLWRRRQRYLLTGWLWYLVTLVPVIGLVQVGAQARADRYMYIPSIGLLLLICCSGASLWRRFPWIRQGLAALALISVSIYSILTFHQVGIWKNNETLFKHALAITENNYICHVNYGRVCLDCGNIDEALVQNKLALKAYPEFVEAMINIGKFYSMKGNPAAAEKYYLQALKYRPEMTAALNNLAWLWATTTDPDYRKPSKALALAEKAAKLSHYEDFYILDTLGAAYANAGDFDNAIQWTRQAITLAKKRECTTEIEGYKKRLLLYQQQKPFRE